MKKSLFGGSPGALLGLFGLAVLWAWRGAYAFSRSLLDYLLPSDPAPHQIIDAPPAAQHLTAQCVRPVMDQRPRIEVFTLPQNTFAF
ncbi:hypothetical protein [uncultured Deinococcus sp.]|uniref:hypothetical protein n=1 Tax=uncultured Deinococcus sp. TaxID=158789 RepID=UPI0025E5D30A|nr:hypothetical protein [uncultured Deinococcus sp.]